MPAHHSGSRTSCTCAPAGLSLSHRTLVAPSHRWASFLSAGPNQSQSLSAGAEQLKAACVAARRGTAVQLRTMSSSRPQMAGGLEPTHWRQALARGGRCCEWAGSGPEASRRPR